MYRTNPTLSNIEQQVAKEVEEQFGLSLSPDLIHYIYGSQSLGVLHYMERLETVKMRGLVVFTPSTKKLKKRGIVPKGHHVYHKPESFNHKPLPDFLTGSLTDNI